MFRNLFRNLFGENRPVSPLKDYTETWVVPPSKKLRYLSENGRGYFEFEPELTSQGHYKIHILKQPGYNGRRQDIHTTHRHINLPTKGGYRICFGEKVEPTVRTLEDVKKYAKMWAEATMDYIDKGELF